LAGRFFYSANISHKTTPVVYLLCDSLVEIAVGSLAYSSTMADQKLLSAQQISTHNSPDDCWVVVDNQVWDVTDFLEEHPGGSTSTNIHLPTV